MCAPAVPLVDEVKAELAAMKAKMDAKSDASGYTATTIQAAIDAGAVDTTMLAATFDFSDEARKMAMKYNGDMMMMKKEMAVPFEGSFASVEGKLDPSIIAEVEKIYKADVAAFQAEAGAPNPDVDAMQAKIKEVFGGVYDMAVKEEKAAEATMAKCIADMEKLELDVADVSNVTIAEILEREPELRAEVEEEIRNNVWAP